MEENKKPRSLFNLELFNQALKNLLDPPSIPERRDFLKVSAGAGAAAMLAQTGLVSSTPPPISVKEGASYTAEQLGAAVDSYIEHFDGPCSHVYSTPEGVFGEEGAIIRNPALYQRILGGNYIVDKMNFAYDNDPKLAMMELGELREDLVEHFQRANQYLHFIQEHPDGIKTLAEQVSLDPRYHEMTMFPEAEIVENGLNNAAEYFRDYEITVERDLVERITQLDHQSNGWFYRKFNQFLPNTTPTEQETVKEEIIKNYKGNIFKNWGSSPVLVHTYAEDEDSEGRIQPTYLVTIDYKKENTFEQNSQEYNTLLAKLKASNPSELYSDDDMNLAAHAMEGKLLLTPTRAGILVTFPIGYEVTSLDVMEKTLSELALNTKTRRNTAEMER